MQKQVVKIKTSDSLCRVKKNMNFHLVHLQGHATFNASDPNKNLFIIDVNLQIKFSLSYTN